MKRYSLSWLMTRQRIEELLMKMSDQSFRFIRHFAAGWM
jgi:uncharacterized protein YggT (Ycf19 family)